MGTESAEKDDLAYDFGVSESDLLGLEPTDGKTDEIDLRDIQRAND